MSVEQEYGTEMQEEQTAEVDYAALWPRVQALAGEHPELVNFAYLLGLFQFCLPREQEQLPFSYSMRVNFCSATLPSLYMRMQLSRLEQIYTAYFFTIEYCYYEYDNLEKAIFSGKYYCPVGKNCPVEACPYALAYYMNQYAQALGRDIRQLYSSLLGETLLPLKWGGEEGVELNPEDIRGIDAKSAHGAYDLLRVKAISLEYENEMVFVYRYLPLCQRQDRDSFIPRLLDMWREGKSEIQTLLLGNRGSFLSGKREECRRCGYAQCPDKLAAYFILLGRKYGRDPLDIAFQVARQNTYAGLEMRDNYQFNRFLDQFRQSALVQEDKAHFAEMIHYITSRSRNRNIPLLPFSMAIAAPDPASVQPLMLTFNDALWYFQYFECTQENIILDTIYYSADSFSVFLKYYNNLQPGTTVLLYDVEFMAQDEEFREGYHKLLRVMEEKKLSNFTILCDTKVAIQTFLAKYPEFRRRIFTRTFEIQELSDEEVLDELEEKLAANLTMPEEVRAQLAGYIKMTYPSAPQRSMEYVDLLYEKLMFKHFNSDINAGDVLLKEDIPYVKPPRTEQEIFDDLNRLTGLQNVKTELKNINDLIRFNIKIGRKSKERISLHMVFSGNAGTGKTTVARLMAEILYSIGFIQENKLVVCSAKDLVGEYIGQTAPLTAQVCASAYNGVLFIDEAYQLNPCTGGNTGVFREECIAELIQQMENNRDKLVVIFAGYTQEMEEFLDKANTGLRSRIARTIEFPDYTTPELLQILEGIARDSGITLDESAREKARQIFDKARQDPTRFGNARFARNLFERSLVQHAAITRNLPKEDPELYILHGDEITMPSAQTTTADNVQPRMGFV